MSLSIFALLLCVGFVFSVQTQFKASPDNDGYVVQQIHMAQGKTSAEMTIQWVINLRSIICSLIIFMTAVFIIKWNFVCAVFG